MHSAILKVLWMTFVLCGIVAAEVLPSPTNIRVTERTKTSFTVRWEQPPSQMYRTFSAKISPTSSMEGPQVSSSLHATFSGLRSGAEYVITVQGFTADGLASRILTYPVWTTPEEPAELTLSPIHEISISISIMGVQTKFSAVVDGMKVTWKDRDSTVTGYDLQLTPDEGVTVSSDDDNLSGMSNRIITGLTPGKEYSVSLRSRVGQEFDPVFSLPVKGKTIMPPAVPYSLEIIESEPTSVVLKAHGPLEGLHDDLFFDLKPNHGSIGKPTPDPIYPMFDRFPLNGLKPGIRYKLDVYSVSKNVKGYKPKTVTFTTLPGAPMRLRVDDFDHYSITLHWAHPHKFNDLDGVQYAVEYFEIPGGEKQVVWVKNFKLDQSIVVVIQDLIPGIIYDFRVYTVLDGNKGTKSSNVIQTTIPMKPTLSKMTVGETQGIKLIFGKPEEGECPTVKTFYSPGLNGIPIKPEFYRLGETVEFPEFPTNGQHRVHARCVSQNVEGPELLVTLDSADATIDPGEKRPRNDVPDRRPELPCSSLLLGIIRPDSIAPDACCNERPYNSEQRECCGNALLEKGGNRLCCNETPYNKRYAVCCSTSQGKVVKFRRNGCPSS